MTQILFVTNFVNGQQQQHIQEFPKGKHQSKGGRVPTYYSAKFSYQPHENEENLTGARLMAKSHGVMDTVKLVII